MRSKRLNLSDYLAANLPSELWWFNRPPHGVLDDDWRERRTAWCAIHHVDQLTLIRHDAAAKRAAAGMPPQPSTNHHQALGPSDPKDIR